MSWRATRIIAGKEVHEFARSGRFLAMMILLIVIMTIFGVLVPNQANEWKEVERAYLENGDGDIPDYLSLTGPKDAMRDVLSFPLVGMLSLLQIFALLLCSDAINSERSARTLGILLSKPVSRTSLVLGKFLARWGLLTAGTILVFLLGFLAMQVFLPGGSPSDLLWFGGVVGILVLGTAAFCAAGVLLSTVTRSTGQSAVLAVVAWFILFPAVGSAGLTATVADDDFVYQGRFNDPAALAACGQRPERTSSAEELEAWMACREPFQEEVDAYYAQFGIDPEPPEVDTSRCEQMHERNATMEEGQQVSRCFERAYANQTAYHEARQDALLAKYDTARIDWSMYLTPANPMLVTATGPLGGDRFSWPVNEPMEAFFMGRTIPPASVVGSVVALAAWTAVYLVAAAFVVRRRPLA